MRWGVAEESKGRWMCKVRVERSKAKVMEGLKGSSDGQTAPDAPFLCTSVIY